ncbi:unnamed protein product [Urochloa decumbens]|uniref:Nucleolar protein 58/56 N-terminal domain-containing protein n=1 Tax=Urochloa decumbens TaxID=240449 RepID=A0ABC9A0I7_9POAL
MLLLFETPTGFAVFRFSEVNFHLPNVMEKVWVDFADAGQASLIVWLKEFRTFEDKASAINVTGVNEELASMITRWLLPEMKLAVGKHEYKRIIESKLGITCAHNDIVMEVMWGIQHQMHKLVRKEKAEVAKEDRLPMSQGLKTFLRSYGFDVKPEMVNEQIVRTAKALYECDAIEDNFSTFLRDASRQLKKISGFNCKNWGFLKLATALMVIFCPEEGDDFRKALSEDELKKLEVDAPKYYDILSWALSMRAYNRIRYAYRVRIEKKILLESLIKKAKEACEAEQAQACEKGKVHGESEQIPQEHVMFANLCRMISSVISASNPPFVNVVRSHHKRSWDSAFEPIGLNKPTFCEGLSLGETGGTRIARISGAQPSTSNAIVPYKPFPHAVLLNSCAENQSQNIDDDNMDGNLGISTLPPPLTESEELALPDRSSFAGSCQWLQWFASKFAW